MLSDPTSEHDSLEEYINNSEMELLKNESTVQDHQDTPNNPCSTIIDHSVEGEDQSIQTPNLQSRSLEDYSLPRARTRKQIRLLTRFVDEEAKIATTSLNVEDVEEPKSYQEAVSCNENSKWIKAMEEEMHSLYKNQTWSLTTLPPNEKTVACK